MIQSILAEIENDIRKYSPYPEKVRLVVVSKYVDSKIMIDAFNSGVKIFGENKAQILKNKKESFDLKDIKNVSWHFIGNLQSNKVKYIIDYVDLIHSVNKLSLAEEINRQAGIKGRTINILLEVNISGEESKEGYILENLKNDIEDLQKLKNINIIGLMTMAPLTDNENIIRDTFRNLKNLQDTLNKDMFNKQLKELSMGMTNDYKIALEEGATLIRIGSKIFK
ncbi:MAG: YggS family pyridoxal phosphate-dependent enzyme [Fusobacteriaceae bacterium]|jgi:pyridoxal phosphate enzyme (YggS family)|nr:YggS family pyridoxal phosphate-dependent enzyme [Fusobacteriaceae bacterium]